MEYIEYTVYAGNILSIRVHTLHNVTHSRPVGVAWNEQNYMFVIVWMGVLSAQSREVRVETGACSTGSLFIQEKRFHCRYVYWQ